MAIKVNEITEAVKKAGSSNTRVVPMAGSGLDGLHQIEVKENGSWNSVASGLSKRMAEDLIQQATNRVLLG